MVDMKTEQELLKQREYLLSIDTLTELHNRNYLSTKVLVNIDSLSYPQVVIAADVNNLKTINDTYGHAAGDVLLKTFAEALKEACPGNSHIFRVGGDEFLIIITDSSEAQAAETIENIKKATVTRKITFCNNEEFVLTAAFGYAIRFSENITFDELYKAADMDMYSHKRSMKAILDRKVLFREKER